MMMNFAVEQTSFVAWQPLIYPLIDDLFVQVHEFFAVDPQSILQFQDLYGHVWRQTLNHPLKNQTNIIAG